MLKKFLITLFLFLNSFLIIFPSKKENTNLFDYCYSLEKILFRNAINKSNNASKKIKDFANDIIYFSTEKTRGQLVNEVIDQYKNSKKIFIITFISNKIYCLMGYWIEEVNPGTFTSILYEKSKQKIKNFKNIEEEAEEFIEDITSEYKKIKQGIYDLF